MKFVPEFKHSIIQKLILFLAFSFFTPITLFASIFSLISLEKNNQNIVSIPTTINTKTTRILTSSNNDNFPSLGSKIIYEDGRADILKNYLTGVNSELADYSSLLVSTADKYNLDYRLLTAISIKESGACRVIPPGSHNCWGWGIHSAGTLMFDSYPEAIETVSKGLKENYVDKGYITPEQIMRKYAHKDSTTWGDDVAAYMGTLE
jgi:hypothetical protein